MRHSSTPRRTQFSSCDACRLSRVACDASKIGHEPGQRRWGGSCSRCFARSRRCTFEVTQPLCPFSVQYIILSHLAPLLTGLTKYQWIKKSSSRLRKELEARSTPPTAESSVTYESSDPSVIPIGGQPVPRRMKTQNLDISPYSRLVLH